MWVIQLSEKYDIAAETLNFLTSKTPHSKIPDQLVDFYQNRTRPTHFIWLRNTINVFVPLVWLLQWIYLEFKRCTSWRSKARMESSIKEAEAEQERMEAK